MARKHQAVELLRQGFSPSQIAKEMGISTASVVGYLCTRVGEGALKISDIFFAIPKETRELFESAIDDRDGRVKVDFRRFKGTNYSREEFALFQKLRDPSHFRGDLYELISEVEVELHDLIRSVLISKLGLQAWWRDGVPVSIRKDCVVRREEDDDPIGDDFAYTTFIHLKKILDDNWTTFKDVFPKRWANDKQKLLAGLNKLNTIRNAVMHPVKKRTWTEENFELVRCFHRGLRECTPPKGPTSLP